MTDLRKAAQAALDWFDNMDRGSLSQATPSQVFNILRAALAEPEQSGWVGLTDAQQEALTRIPILAWEIYDHWDEGREMKVGKCLRALAGQLKNYDVRYTAILDAIEALRAKNAVPERVPMTEDEMRQLLEDGVQLSDTGMLNLMRRVEAHHGIKEQK